MIRFELDFISPYAYVAWHAVQPIAARHGLDIEPVPILFAALLDAHGHRGPAEIEPKRRYVFKDCFRKAAAAGVPLVPPPGHPFNPLLALRVASLDMPAETRRALVTALFDATWATGEGVTDPAVVGRVAAEHGLHDAVARASEPAAKARVRDATAAALDRGTFGVPSLWVGDELFWGVDALGHLDAFLNGEDPVPTGLLERWEHIRPESRRPGSR
ncbi:MAG: 2-hydroxychromene-2-carboxylate isomerase [Alphaproteobacteria bacterium]|nr:2-hydroxychromene-2-carboxylate isomerase [Alphaproteobacteria bacterium]